MDKLDDIKIQNVSSLKATINKMKTQDKMRENIGKSHI